MSQSSFSSLLLRTAFSFMTCDGHIDKKEIVSIIKMGQQNNLFGEVAVDEELEIMLKKINLRGTEYLKDYFRKVEKANLSDEEQLEIIKIAVDVIYSDMEVREDEIKFLRVLRTMLDISDSVILTRFPQLAKDFMWDDEFTDEYVKKLHSNYFKDKQMPLFDVSDVIDITADVLRELK
ncbi:TerB family tellurite resistance protein [Reichenbachiella agarivorans]|uniref:TerB family tellurite resistance protein n=1 Tax=Reichenbachiella agarivorans TaxID=2979464 RepID=A0ABY6D0M8_9BACT|nr:TerB family tellurite resistance protein [Reichenbachiella agarivorans]UXP34035.1 TerB family tellurite resistance protein [Reichenbachiella agarivorans]